MKLAPMPWILCGPAVPSVSSGESLGSTPTIWTEGLRDFSTRLTPVTVPPVPMPATKMSTLPSVSAQISSAVVFSWIAGLAGLPNWLAETAFGVSAMICLARATAPAMPSEPGVSTICAP